MSIRRKGNGYVVELYDPKTKRKQHIKPADHGMGVPRTERQARALERAALNARDARPHGDGETVADFAGRWTRDFPRGGGSNVTNAERVRQFAKEHGKTPIRDIARPLAREWAQAHPSQLPALRAMFNDAVKDGLAQHNPFAKLGLKRAPGRRDITVLTAEEVHSLADIARDVHGPVFGPEMAGMVLWAAYTCMRPGETFAARYSRLNGDTYDLREQFNRRLRRETQPKHGGMGEVYIPQPALQAVMAKPRRLDDDLIFRTKRGRQFRQESLSWSWAPIRAAFIASLPETHHLRRRLERDPEDRFDFYEMRHFGASYMLNVLGLQPWVIAQQMRHDDGGALVTALYGHPERKVALEQMRRAFTAPSAATPIRRVAHDREAM
jgi:integrase